jgi:CubicO group peptidase (beta-lactamase class C family)
MRRRTFLLTVSALVLASAIPALGQQATFDPAALAALKGKIEASIAKGDMPGAVWLLAKGDEVIVDTAGSTSYEDGVPMRRDTIFRIASVGKAVGTAAVMMLVEDKKLSLDEPVDRLLPELANRQVLKDLKGPITDTVPATRPILVRDLMNFTLGFGVLFDPTLPIQQAIDARQLVNGPPVPPTPWTPDEWLAKFAELPLMHQPGETWMYNTGSLLLGVLIARASGMPLEDFLATRIFTPLGMVDTGFYVPPDKLERFQPAYGVNFASNEQFLEDPVDGVWSRPPSFPSAAGGLVSTLDDYLAFARMLLNRGEYKGTRLLTEASVAEMTRNQLTPEQKQDAGFVPGFFDKHGWGYGVLTYDTPDDITPTPGRYGWDGGYGTSWANDPATGLIGLMFTQSVQYYIASNQFRDFWRGAFTAIGAETKGVSDVPELITHDVAVTRSFNASPERAWRAWTEDAEVMKWWGPRPWTSPEARMDVREGGYSVVLMRSPEGHDLWMRWEYTRVIPNQRLEYIQNLSDKDGNPIDPTSVGMPPEFPRDVATVVTLTPKGDGTEVTITEHTTTSKQMMEYSKMGLEQVMDQMGKSFDGAAN